MLLVCTGNICRSALAERLGATYVEQTLGDEAGAVRLISAGTAALVGSGMHPHSALVLRGLGGDPTGFSARQFSGDLATRADLVLVMTRAHRSAVLEAAPRCLARTFTVREAADLVRAQGCGIDVRGDTFAQRARALVQDMAQARGHRRAGADDDVLDPIGLPVEVHQEVGDAIAHALLTVLGAVVALHRGDVTANVTAGIAPDRP